MDMSLQINVQISSKSTPRCTYITTCPTCFWPYSHSAEGAPQKLHTGFINGFILPELLRSQGLRRSILRYTTLVSRGLSELLFDAVSSTQVPHLPHLAVPVLDSVGLKTDNGWTR